MPATLGLCLSALIQANILYSIPIITLCTGPPLIAFVFTMINVVRYPAEPITPLDEELGYPCYVVSSNADESGRYVRGYVNFAVTLVIFLLAIVALAVRYKGQRGRLIHVIRRDGGLYYLTLAALRLVSAIVSTPAVLSVDTFTNSPAYIVLQMCSDVIVPIFAQRLMINMRKVDYPGSRPVVSTLLFSPPKPISSESYGVDDEEIRTGTYGLQPVVNNPVTGSHLQY